MSARTDSYHARPDPAGSDRSARSTFKRHPVACFAILLVIAVAAVSWTGFDVDRTGARYDRDVAAQPSPVAAITVDARYLLDDAQREQPWLDELAIPRHVAPTARAGASRPRAGD